MTVECKNGKQVQDTANRIAAWRGASSVSIERSQRQVSARCRPCAWGTGGTVRSSADISL